MARRALWLLLLAGCRPTPPGVLVGESAHFRLYVDPALAPIPVDLDGENGLVALETQWSDVHTLLEMPEGKIDYWWLATENIDEACGGDIPQSGCTREDTLEVIAPTLPHAHELNHAYMFLRSHRRVVPFLAEGIAEAIGCTSENASVVRDDIAWPAVVAALPSLDLQNEGALFAKHLIRTRGIDAFLRYYEQSPERRDPALFAANFKSFWGISLDDVWTAIHAVTPGLLTQDAKICPCSLPALPTDGPVQNDAARAPYWTLPEVGAGESLALTPPGGNYVIIRDCAGVQPDIRAREVLAQFPPGIRRFVLPRLLSATRGAYITTACEQAAPYQLPSDFLVGTGYLSVIVPKPATGSAIAHVRIEVPSAAHVRRGSLQAVCDSCAFDSCPPPSPATQIAVQGTFYGRMELFGTPGDGSDVLNGEFGIGP